MCVYRNVCDEFIESARMARIRMYSVIYVRYVCLWFLWYWLNKIIISIIYTFIIYSFPHISMLLVFIAMLPLILSWTIFTFADNTHSIPLNRSICFVNLDPPRIPILSLIVLIGCHCSCQASSAFNSITIKTNSLFYCHFNDQILMEN